jgi:hypothetical protein
MGQFQPHDRTNLLLAQLLGTTSRPTRLFGQTFQSFTREAFSPLVARLGAYPVFLAERLENSHSLAPSAQTLLLVP